MSESLLSPTPLLERDITLVRRVRAARPLIHCLTNVVTVGRVADAIAALGARPVMASAPEEAADMVAHAQALVLNLGTPDASRWEAATAAGVRAAQRGIPVIVDPVGCGATPWRTAQARALVASVRPTVVRGNVMETASLAGIDAPAGVRAAGVGVDDRDATADHLCRALNDLAQQAARALSAPVVVTGRVDAISDGEQVHEHTTGVPALEALIGAGDVLTALIACCLAVEPDTVGAARSGLNIFTAAASRAASGSTGPGTFWMAFMDSLAALDRDAEQVGTRRSLEEMARKAAARDVYGAGRVAR